MRTPVSIGITSLTPLETVRALAPRVERLGFHALWINDLPGGDSLDGLRAAASVTERIGLATGVIPLDRRPAGTLVLGGIPADRLVLGVGSGRAERPLALVEQGIAALRDATEAAIVVGALGPRMRRLAAERGDGALFNWLTPDAAATTTAELHDAGGARSVRGILYTRTTVDDAARPALEREAAAYESFPAYAANFARLGFRAIDATIGDPDALAAYEGAPDELVLRAITPSNSLDELERFVETAAAWVRSA
jgi:alkanesulfonate monooxygenase SsuD/methylene tetrahydromethanopterin reductase-like flavin-dependent oxidoreductase (luciferase family)